MSERAFSVLFLCMGNSARSIMAEALLRQVGGNRFIAYSAGSRPTWRVSHMALETLARHGIVDAGLRSKSWGEFAGPDAPALDFVFTLCDVTAGEPCPAWPGDPMTANWSVADPASADGGELERLTTFRETFRVLERRIQLFANLPLHSLDRISLQAQLRDIGLQTGRD
jgi:arsenate reductase